MKYRVSKISENAENNDSWMSRFGNSKEFFEGHSVTPPTNGERFELRDSLGGLVISTSPVIKVEKDVFTTTYSVYRYEQIR